MKGINPEAIFVEMVVCLHFCVSVFGMNFADIENVFNQALIKKKTFRDQNAITATVTATPPYTTIIHFNAPFSCNATTDPDVLIYNFTAVSIEPYRISCSCTVIRLTELCFRHPTIQPDSKAYPAG